MLLSEPAQGIKIYNIFARREGGLGKFFFKRNGHRQNVAKLVDELNVYSVYFLVTEPYYADEIFSISSIIIHYKVVIRTLRKSNNTYLTILQFCIRIPAENFVILKLLNIYDLL